MKHWVLINHRTVEQGRTSMSGRIVIPGKKLIPKFAHEQDIYLIDRKIAQYVRQSSDVQVQQNKSSKANQDKKLREGLIEIGGKKVDIEKIDADQGIRGAVSID